MSFPTNKALVHIAPPVGGWPVGSDGAKDAINRVRIHTKAVPMSVARPFGGAEKPTEAETKRRTKAGLDRIRELAQEKKQKKAQK